MTAFNFFEELLMTTIDDRITITSREHSPIKRKVDPVLDLQISNSLARRSLSRTAREIPKKKVRKSCNDLWALILYVLCSIVAGGVGYVSSSNGNINLLILPFQSDGAQCGIDVIPSYLLYFNLTTAGGYKKCVSTCPSAGSYTCRTNITLSTNTTIKSSQLQNGSCILNVGTVNAFFRCVPLEIASINAFFTVAQLQSQQVLASDFQNETAMSRLFCQIFSSSLTIGFAIIISVFTSCLWYYLLQVIGSRLLYLSGGVILMIAWAATGYLAYLLIIVRSLKDIAVQTGYAIIDTNIYNPLYIGIVLFFVGLLATILSAGAIYYRNQIKATSSIIAEAGNHLRKIKLLPLISFLSAAIIVTLTAWITLTLGLLVTVKLSKSKTLGSNIIVDSLILFLVVWYIWSILLIYAFNRCVVSAAVVKIYWRGRDDVFPQHLLSSIIKRLLRYQMGSIIFGVLAIPTIYLFNLIEYGLRPSFGKARVIEEVERKNVFDRMKEKLGVIMISVNSRAFIEMATNCNDFYLSATRVEINPKLNFISKLGYIITWIMISTITLGDVSLGALFSEFFGSVALDSALPTLIIIFFLATVISCLFLHSFSIAVDSILYSCSEDLDKNDGSIVRPYQMSPSLQALIT